MSADPDLPGPAPNLDLIPAGSLIIPMNNGKRNLVAPFNLRAYGLFHDDGDSVNPPTDTDVGSFDTASTTIDIGDGSNVNNAQLDIPADSVLAVIFTVRMQ